MSAEERAEKLFRRVLLPGGDVWTLLEAEDRVASERRAGDAGA